MRLLCGLSLWACLSGCIQESWGRSLLEDVVTRVAFTHPRASVQQLWFSAQSRAAVHISKVSKVILYMVTALVH
jgi:hypothetical protein